MTPERREHDKQHNTVVQLPRQQPQGQPLGEVVSARPEALVRANVQVTVAGHPVQFMLQDRDEQRLLVRLEAFLQGFSVEDTPQHAAVEDWCTIHSARMTPKNNKHGSWWSHQLTDGTWCKGKER